ncbi:MULTISPECIES: CHAT domain-containing protein [Spirulina sp. CCY15215]|uniref:CHAT domain-containing protein n=1 Tax=Spirulina sp. CCY15215 TaxID=2767591 RepID=UPI00194DE352|nr:CHAT domain-containing protein [Spirulina major]
MSFSVLTREVLASENFILQGRRAYEAGNYEAAREYLLQALPEAEDNAIAQITILSNLSSIYQQLGDWEQGEETLKRAEILLNNEPRSTQKTDLFAQIQTLSGQLAFLQGHSDRALEAWKQAEESYREIEQIQGQIESKVYQTIALQELGFYREALKILLSLFPQVSSEDRLLQGKVFHQLGNTIRVVGKVEALEQYNLFDRQGDSEEEKDYLQVSEVFLNKSLEITNQLGQNSDRADILLDLGNTIFAQYYRLKDDFYRRYTLENKDDIPFKRQLKEQIILLDRALNYYQQVQKIDNILPEVKQQARLNAIDLMLEFYPRQQKEDFALLGGFSELQELQNHSDVFLAELTALEADISTLPLSQTHLKMQLKLIHQRIQWYKLTGEEISLPQFEQLLQKAEKQAQELQSDRDYSYVKGYRGYWQELQGNLETAQQLTEEAILLTEKIRAPEVRYLWEWQLGRILAAESVQKPYKTDSAIAAYRSALNNLDRVREDIISLKNPDFRFLFRDDVEPIYREFAALLLRFPTSLEVAQKQDDQKREEAIAPEKVQEAISVIERLQVAELEDYLRCNLQQRSQTSLEQYLTRNSQAKAASIYPILLGDRLRIIAQLPDQKAPIYYTHPEPISRQEMYEKIDQLRRAISEKKFSKNNTIFSEIYNLLLGGIETKLEASGVKSLVFVMDSELRNIPLASLYDGEKYVIERYNLSLNIGLEVAENKPLIWSETPILAAGISERNLNKKPLPYVKEELEFIKNYFDRAEILLNGEFTISTLQDKINQNPFAIVHLATHGIFSSNPDETVLFASGETIHLNQLSQLLSSQQEQQEQAIELLVLSACETAVGDKRATLGIAGIATQAGAKSTLATLFTVDDEPTAQLMETFYKKLNTSHISKAEALRQAQLSLLQGDHSGDDSEYQKPYYWSSYILVGNWQ